MLEVLGMGLSASGVLQLSPVVFTSPSAQGNAGGLLLLGGLSSGARSSAQIHHFRRGELKLNAGLWLHLPRFVCAVHCSQQAV